MPFPDNHHPHGVVSPPPPPKPNPKLLSLVLKAIIMAFVTTLFFLFLGVAAILLALATAAFHLHNNHQSNRRSRSPLPEAPPSGLSVRELKRVPQFRESRARGDAECVICLEGIRQGQWCRRLPRCGHVFHRLCLDSWLVKVPSCPVCRARVRSGNLVMEEEEDNREMSTVVSGFDWRSDLSVLVN